MNPDVSVAPPPSLTRTILSPATSTAPQVQIGKKRRLSVSDDEDAPSPSTPKKSRIATPADEPIAASTQAETSVTAEGVTEVAEGVKEVTEGVREVELDDGVPKIAPEEVLVAAEAAAVPLPESPTLKPIEEPTASDSSAVPIVVEAEQMVVAHNEDTGEQISLAEAVRVSDEVKETTETPTAPPPTDLQESLATAEATEAAVEEKETKDTKEVASASGSLE